MTRRLLPCLWLCLACAAPLGAALSPALGVPPDVVEIVPPPTKEELEALRTEVDKTGVLRH